MTQSVCIVGGALAGGTAAVTLRQMGFDGELFLISDEINADYDRPSLSKSVLCGQQECPPPLFESGWIESNRIELLPSTRVDKLHTDAGELVLSNGSTLRADKILLCTGSRARMPEIGGIARPGVFSLRTDLDSIAIRSSISTGSEVVIIGGGLIGCEVATSLVKLGCKVTVVESAPALLLRVLGEVGNWMHSRLATLGVTVLLNSQVTSIEGNGHVTGVQLASGDKLSADVILVAIGAEPNAQLAVQAGLVCERGIVVDARGVTSNENILAAGDVASWPIRGGGRRSLETYLNSQAQAQIAAAAILGRAEPAEQVPNSWTEIAGHRLQMAGDIVGPGEILHRGAVGEGPSLAFRIREGRTEAVIAIDAAADFGVAKRMIDDQSSVLPDELRDQTIRLRDIHKKSREVAL